MPVWVIVHVSFDWTVSFNQKAQLVNGAFEDSCLGTHFNLSNKTSPVWEGLYDSSLQPEILLRRFSRDKDNIANWGRTHFCLSSRRGRYYLLHLLHKISSRYCTCFHVQLENKSSFLNRLGGKVTSDLRNNRWFGVMGSILFGSLDTGVMGRLFVMLSTSHIKVTRLSSSAICSRSKACRIFRTVHIHLS